MGVEIERTFLVRGDGWRGAGSAVRVRQAYLTRGGEPTVRVRLAAGRGTLTIKGPGLATRAEFEYEIPPADAEELLDLARTATIDKTRHRVEVGGRTWEVDEFHGPNAPLVLAELELEREDAAFERPAWLGEEVTDDPRYANARLALEPFGSWPERD